MNDTEKKAEKLQKVLSLAGIGSRREMEKWIESGFIKVNGVQATIGMRVTDSDKIKVKGKLINNPLKRTKKTRVVMYNKPQGVICSKSDPEGKKTIYQAIKKLDPNKWILVGRLDVNTSGLILLTTDGDLAHRLMHPSYEIEREYAVRIAGQLTKEQQALLLNGIVLEDGKASFDTLVPNGGEGLNHWYHVTLKEGRNREVRRMFEKLDLQVSRLIRIRYGALTLPRYLRRGNFKELPEDMVLRLKESVGLGQAAK